MYYSAIPASPLNTKVAKHFVQFNIYYKVIFITMYPMLRLVLIAVKSLTVKIHAVLLFSFIIVHIILILLMTSMLIISLLW